MRENVSARIGNPIRLQLCGAAKNPHCSLRGINFAPRVCTNLASEPSPRKRAVQPYESPPPPPKAPRLWVCIAPAARALVPRDHILALPRPPLLAVRRSSCVQGAEFAGPWVLRSALRVSLEDPRALAPAQGTRWLGALHARWLGYMGVHGLSVYDGRAVRHWASFVARAPGDVMLGERKVTSVAEARGAGETLLMASTLLQQPPWPLLCRAVGAPLRDLELLDESAGTAATTLATQDPELWAAHLRRMLHLSLALRELQEEGAGS